MLHLALQEDINREFAGYLANPVELCRDALLVRFEDGTEVELRFLSESEYSIGWRHGASELRIDTAPLHAELGTFPNHLHDAAGKVRADPLSQPGRAAWENVRSVLKAVASDPLLAGR